MNPDDANRWTWDDTHITRCTCGAWRYLTHARIEAAMTARLHRHPDPNPCRHMHSHERTAA